MTTIDMLALVLVGGLLLTMPVFAIVARNRALDADVARRSRTILLGHWVRDWLMWVIGPIERGMVRAGVSPDLLNYLGVLFGFAAGVAFASGMLAAAGWLIFLGGVADVFDGRVARARGISSQYGAFADSTLDRFAESFTFLGLVVFFAASPLLVLATTAGISGSLLVSYTRARGEAVGVSNTAGVMQRAERLVLLGLGGILDPWITSSRGWAPGTLLGGIVGIIAIGAWGTAIYRTFAIGNELKKR
ncbi:MAG TPA: CDP-alcohol phosphatidyltransferase family protein [Gemmatimonadaceae bacterium]|nr:CDP-alcohol phosphatidyltransferase family protein [Gemmatimonadaceae bacterium]